MKKIYFLVLAAIILGMNATAQQNVVVGSDMEDGSVWNVTQIVPNYLATATFGYTDDGPSAGSGAALRVECTNEASQGTNVIIWQEVELIAGHRYVVDAAFKALNLIDESFWAQWLVESNATLPVEGSDYSAEKNAVAQINSWNGEVPNEDWANLDITLQTWDFENAVNSDTVVVAEDGTYVFGVKMGIWNGEQISFDVLIDDMTLTDLDAEGTVETGISSMELASVEVYPNPASSTIAVKSNEAFNTVRILNAVGQESMRVNTLSGNIDVAGLNSGVYIVELMNNNTTVARSRFVKK